MNYNFYTWIQPLYAYYLQKFPHLYRPYREELLQTLKTDGPGALDDIYGLFDQGHSVVFAKHMARHMTGLEEIITQPEIQWKGETIAVRHVFLFRHPLSILASWDCKREVHQEKCSLHVTGLLSMLQLYTSLEALGQSSVVVDSDILLKHPNEVLTELSIRLGIPPNEAQLAWAPGPKSCDGYVISMPVLFAIWLRRYISKVLIAQFS